MGEQFNVSFGRYPILFDAVCRVACAGKKSAHEGLSAQIGVV